MPCVVGHSSFFAFMAELKNPRDFPKALYLLQGVDMSLYIVAAVVIYYYAGSDVAWPALGSAGPLISKIAYGMALPSVSVSYHSQKWLLLISQIIIAGIIGGHVCFKTIYMRIFRGTDRMHKRDLVAVGSWIGIALFLWVLAWIISSAIPVFSDLLSLIVSHTPRPCEVMVLTGPDGLVRQLVHIRLEWDLLAVYEQGSILFFPEEDRFDYSQSHYCWDWSLSGMFQL